MVDRHARGGNERLTFRALVGPLERLRGLLGTGPDAQPVALVRCGNIHTIGMRYRLDVAFVSAQGVVLEVWRSVPPARLLGNPRAWMTLERPHRRDGWLAAGEQVDISLVKED